LAKPNYKFEKRQKDLARQKKKEEKLQRKTALKVEGEAEAQPEEGQDTAAPESKPEEQ